MAKKTKQPESPAGHIPAAPTHKEELTKFLAELEIVRNQDRSHTLAAFEALTYVWSYLVCEKVDDSSVRIPRWVLEDLCEGYKRYKESANTQHPTRLGEAYGIESGHKGTEPKILSMERNLRDLRIALRIAFAKEAGSKIDAEINKLASETNLSEPRVRAIWEKHRQAARQMVRNYQKRA